MKISESGSSEGLHFMKNLFLFLLLLVAMTPVQAQIVTSGPVNATPNVNLPGNVDPFNGINPTYKTLVTDLRGNPYLFGHWSIGEVVYKTGLTHKNLALKYDLYNDELVYRNPQTNQALAFIKDQVLEFTLRSVSGDSLFHFIKLSYPTEGFPKRPYYFQVYYQGKTALLARKKKFIEKGYAQNNTYTAGRDYDEFYLREEFYFMKEDRKIIAFKPQKKAILELLNDKLYEVSEFIQREKINLKKTEDLIRLFRYYDGLLN